MLGWDRWPWEGEPVGLAAREARISLVLTMGSGARHFLALCDFGFRFFFLDILRCNICNRHFVGKLPIGYVWYGMI